LPYVVYSLTILVDFETVVFRMYRTFFVFLKCTIQGGPKVDVLLIAFLIIWLKFWEGIDKYWIVPVRKLFYFQHCLLYEQHVVRRMKIAKLAKCLTLQQLI